MVAAPLVVSTASLRKFYTGKFKGKGKAATSWSTWFWLGLQVLCLFLGTFASASACAAAVILEFALAQRGDASAVAAFSCPSVVAVIYLVEGDFWSALEGVWQRAAAAFEALDGHITLVISFCKRLNFVVEAQRTALRRQRLHHEWTWVRSPSVPGGKAVR